jgi:hypothetical protein
MWVIVGAATAEQQVTRPDESYLKLGRACEVGTGGDAMDPKAASGMHVKSGAGHGFLLRTKKKESQPL